MSNDLAKKSDNLLWLVALGFVVAGVLLMADALHFRFLSKLTVRLGSALIFSAIALIAGKDRPASIVSIAVVWLAVIITLLN
jgi:hypothetical protein